MKATFKIDGMDKLKKDLEKLGKVPQKHVTAAARKGMSPVLKNAKSNAPDDTGQLKQGLILVGEKSRYKGKKVFDVVFDSSMNDVFQKPIKNPVMAQRNVAYYPASQEYGYFLRNGQYMPGLRFIHDSLASNAQMSAKIMVDTMQKKIDVEARRVGLR